MLILFWLNTWPEIDISTLGFLLSELLGFLFFEIVLRKTFHHVYKSCPCLLYWKAAQLSKFYSHYRLLVKKLNGILSFTFYSRLPEMGIVTFDPSKKRWWAERGYSKLKAISIQAVFATRNFRFVSFNMGYALIYCFDSLLRVKCHFSCK